MQNFADLIAEPRYLEVGVNEGATFNSIRATAKVAVDPAFAFRAPDGIVALDEVRLTSYHAPPPDQLESFAVRKRVADPD